VVIGDVPPLAFAAARLAGIPSIAVANFTWDWIYESFPQFNSDATTVLDTVRAAYADATFALRLPFFGGFQPMARVTRDIALVARRGRRPRTETRRALGLSDGLPVVLASFGGHGLGLPYGEIAADGGFTLVVTDHELDRRDTPARVRSVASEELLARDIRYEDLVAASDVVVTKPGYGIVSECLANGAAMVYASRGRFPEEGVLVGEMPRYLRCRAISHDDLFAGRWQSSIEGVLAQPAPPEQMALDGADQAADAILESVRHRSNADDRR
jgi:L-arabinokinase